MAFNDLEYHAVKKKVDAFVSSIRPPEHVRNELDILYTIKDQTIAISEERPVWQGEPGERCKLESAKITYLRTQKKWKLYWMRGTLKWELYQETATLQEALDMVKEDVHGCFFG
ncbi:DUF3024 domain-containing protein [Erwinia tasmaniensis]|uniref:DUF3024 domain-containing protein n=1 Tax=Erwinia tasmaniensis TaxID=338565 RepID=UPI003A4DF8D8